MKVSASKLGLAAKCLAWTELPCVESSSEAAAIGTEVHAWIESMLVGTTLPTLSTAAAAMHPQKAVCWINDLLTTHAEYHLVCEQAYAASQDEAKELQIKAREYPVLPEGWVVGTADVVVDCG